MTARWRTADVKALLKRCAAVRTVRRVGPVDEDDAAGDLDDEVDILIVRPQAGPGWLYVVGLPKGSSVPAPYDFEVRGVALSVYACHGDAGQRCVAEVRQVLLDAGFAVAENGSGA